MPKKIVTSSDSLELDSTPFLWLGNQVDVITKKAGDDVAYKFSSDGTGEFEDKSR